MEKRETTYPDDFSTIIKSVESEQRNVLKMFIPVCFLFGRQRNDEYSRKKRELIEMCLARDGIVYLLENPILSVVLFSPNATAQIVIIDGHHRARYAPKHNIFTIPSQIAPLILVAQMLKQSPTEFETILTAQIRETLESFSRMPPSKQPLLIEGVSNMDQLATRFQHF